MKKFLINIYAYDHHGRFEVESKDDAISLEQAIVDKLGEKSIVWESSGMFRNTPYRITYCLLYTSPSPRDATLSRMPSSA